MGLDGLLIDADDLHEARHLELLHGLEIRFHDRGHRLEDRLDLLAAQIGVLSDGANGVALGAGLAAGSDDLGLASGGGGGGLAGGFAGGRTGCFAGGGTFGCFPGASSTSRFSLCSAGCHGILQN